MSIFFFKVIRNDLKLLKIIWILSIFFLDISLGCENVIGGVFICKYIFVVRGMGGLFFIIRIGGMDLILVLIWILLYCLVYVCSFGFLKFSNKSEEYIGGRLKLD